MNKYENKKLGGLETVVTKLFFVFRRWRWVGGRFVLWLPSDLYLCIPNAMGIVEHIGNSWDSLRDSQEDCADVVECYLSHISTSRQLHLYSLARWAFVLADVLAH